MTVGTNFIRGANPVWSYVDLAGMQFDSTFWLWTLTNQIPYIPYPVYQDPGGTTPWPDPVQFQANGTLPNNLYWDDTQVYRLEIRQHVGLGPPTQADPLIYLVENYIPNGTGITPGMAEGIVTDNQISNPQFAFTNFVSPLSLTSTTGLTVEIAPDWYLILSGPGTVTITLHALNTTVPTPTNAPYALEFSFLGSWTAPPVLRQYFTQNGQNWQGRYLNSSITAMIMNAPQMLTMRVETTTGTSIGLLQQPLLNNNFVEYTGNVLVAPYANLNVPPNAGLQYSIYFPYNCDVYITSLQLLVSDSAQNYSYEQDTVERQFDKLFHYYGPQLSYKPLPSYLVGWDFPLNPAQYGASGGSPWASGANTSNFAWDQTIVFQSANSGVTVSEATDGSLKLTSSASGGCQFAIIQYLEASQAMELLTNPMSVFVSALATAATTATVSLYYTAGSALPSINSSNASIVATLNATGGVATFHNPSGGTWTAVPNGNNGPVQFTIPVSTTYQEFETTAPFQITDGSYSTATFFAIVIGFSSVANTQSVTVNCVGLNAGQIATRPAPQTYQQVLTDCEYYYEKSYDTATAIGTVTNVNAMVAEMGTQNNGTNTYGSNSNFNLRYRTLKRSASPVITLYATGNGASNYVSASLVAWGQTPSTYYVATTSWTPATGTKSTYFGAASNFSGSLTIASWTQGGNCFISYHYVIDARLGY